MEPKVFLIDDEASLRRSLSLGLMQKGYDIEPCESGIKALKTLETHKANNSTFDYVVLDVKLPDIDGVKLLKVIKQMYPGMPVILISGYSGDTLVEEARLEDADGFLEKPFSVDDLTAIFSSISSKNASPETSTTVATPVRQEQKTASTYAALKFDDDAEMMEIYRDLYFHENVLYCDATKGDYDLIVLLQADTTEMVNQTVQNKLLKTPGLREAAVMPVETPLLEEQISSLMATVDRALGQDGVEGDFENKRSSRGGASSYVLLEVEKEKLDTIYPTLYFNDHVVYCDYVKGKYDIVLLMKGTSFADIRNAIRTELRPIDGILKIKESPIINFLES